MLEDAEVLIGHNEGGKRVYALTEEGRIEAERAIAVGAAERWDATANPEDVQRADFRAAVGDLHVAARQVREVADQDQMERAATIVREARQKLYQLLIES